MERELIEPIAQWWRKAAAARGQTGSRVISRNYEAFDVPTGLPRDRCPAALNVMTHDPVADGTYCSRCKILLRAEPPPQASS